LLVQKLDMDAYLWELGYDADDRTINANIAMSPGFETPLGVF
jgi:hypothetical protein